jgi:hypothetical protein
MIIFFSIYHHDLMNIDELDSKHHKAKVAGHRDGFRHI